jgi:ABC-type transport system substrate-binding protein
MKKSIKSLAFFLLISSIILPFLPAITVAQEDLIVFRVSDEALPDDWDPSTTDWYNIIWGQYGAIALQGLITTGPAYTSGTEGTPLDDEWIPILATDWELEEWPSEQNSLGFNNTGGYKSITFTLRENVTFHDGSNWNATVYKWNVDRAYIIRGNFTGKRYDWGVSVGGAGAIHDDNDDYFTASWNMSHFDSPYIGTTPPVEDPLITDYAYFNLGPNASLVDYGPILTPDIMPNNTIRNPNPYGGWDYEAGAAIHYSPYDVYPAIDYVEIIENKASGGKVKIHSNIWNVGGIPWYCNDPMISYHAYRANYTVNSIYGWENDVKHEDNPGIVTHMIGTGPYIFVEHDESGTPPGGHMIKNENYWNKTALEAAGWFDVDKRQVIKFPAGTLGEAAKNTALLTHGIDYSWDSMYSPITEAAKANENIGYVNLPNSEFKTNIVLNCINETWWAWPWADNWRQAYYDQAGSFPAAGVPRGMRKAMSYAFNYDLMIHTVLNDRADRGGGVMSEPNLFYNATIAAQKATYDLELARTILLTTESDAGVFNLSTPVQWLGAYGWNTYGHLPYDFHIAEGYFPNPDLYNYSKICAQKGLTLADVADNTDNNDKWQDVADEDPIFELNFYWDSAHEDVKSVLQTSLKNIGVGLTDKTGATHRVTTIIWDTVRIGWLTTFDGEHSLFSCGAWVMDEHLPHAAPGTNLFWAHTDPDVGDWRGKGGGGITSWHYWGNFGFNFDYDPATNSSPTDMASARAGRTEPVGRKHWYNVMALRQQTVVYSKIWLYDAKEGWALWKDWETLMTINRYNMTVGTSGYGTPQSVFIRYVGLPEEYELIPGAPLLITLSVSAASMIGIVYAIMRKKRLK